MKPRARKDRRFATDPNFLRNEKLLADRRKRADRRQFLLEEIIKPAVRGAAGAVGIMLAAAMPVLLWSLGIAIGGQ